MYTPRRIQEITLRLSSGVGVPTDLLIANLSYVASVLETVYINETKFVILIPIALYCTVFVNAWLDDE